MNTCCRTAALRIFVRSITQIHVPTAVNRLPQSYSTLGCAHRYSNIQRALGILGNYHQTSSLHTSCVHRAEAAAHAPALRGVEHDLPPGLSEIRGTHVEEAAIDHPSESPKPKPMGKWARKKAKLAKERAETVAKREILPEDETTPKTSPPALSKKETPQTTSKEQPTRKEAKAVNTGGSEPKRSGVWARKKARLRRAQAAGKSTKTKATAAKRGKGKEAKAKTADEIKAGKVSKAKDRKDKKEEREGKKADVWEPPEKEPWMEQKKALREKFPEGWVPRKKLSPDALAGIRALHAQFPGEFTTAKLAQKFEVSPEAIRRILKSKWTPSAEEEEERQNRWFNRGKLVWAQWAEIGRKPPARWRAEGVTRHPIWNRPKLERGRVRVSARSKAAVRIDHRVKPGSPREGMLAQKRLRESFLG